MPRRAPAAPQSEAALPPSTPVSVSVDGWMDRVSQYVKPAPQGGAVVFHPDPSERTPGAIQAQHGAKALVEAGGAFADGSSAAGQRLWRLGAREVLADVGVSAIAGEDYWVGLDVVLTGRAGAVDQPEGVQRSALLRGLAGQLAVYGERQYRKNSAESFAALLEAACMMRDAAIANGSDDKTDYSAQVATWIGCLLGAALQERLMPYARDGKTTRTGRARGGRATARRRGTEAEEKLSAVEQIKARRPELSDAAAARIYLEQDDPGAWYSGSDDERQRRVSALLRSITRRRAWRRKKTRDTR